MSTFGPISGLHGVNFKWQRDRPVARLFCWGGGGGVKLVKFWDLLWLRVDYLAIALDLAIWGGGIRWPPDPPPPPATAWQDVCKTLNPDMFSLQTDRGTEGQKDEQSPILYKHRLEALEECRPPWPRQITTYCYQSQSTRLVADWQYKH